MKMKTYKALLKSSLVMLVLFAVAGSGVAQAQECIARAKSSNEVRASGITEVVGDIELRCRVGSSGGFGFGSADEVTIAVELSTNITSEIDADREVTIAATVTTATDATAALGYGVAGIVLTAVELDADGDSTTIALEDIVAGDPVDADTIFMEGELSEDGTMIEWEDIASSALNLSSTSNEGFNLVISGIRANASTVGAGNDITATVLVDGAAVNNVPVKVADVETALEIKLDALTGLQCESRDDDAKAVTITIKESEDFENAIMARADADSPGDSLIVTFLYIPDGVKVTVPMGYDVPDTTENTPERTMADSAFGLEIRTGRTSGADEDGVVDLSAAGAGQVIYDVVMATTSDMIEEEWATLDVMFEWESEGDMPALGAADVAVSFHPLSNALGDTFDDGAKVPRFVESSDPVMVLEIEDCATTLLFPFVTNQQGFETGLAITNTSKEDGSCTIEYSGSDAPAKASTGPVEGGEQWITGLSAIAPKFQGYITADCGFRDAYGFAFVSNGYPAGPPTAAHGYLAVCMEGKHCPTRD